MKRIYLDYAATTPCDPLVVEAMRPYFLEQFGNASSPHAHGRGARKAVEQARENLAAFLGAHPTEIIFTSCATESNNTAIFGIAHALADKGKHIIVSAIEHHSVLAPVKRLAEQGYDITYLLPDPNGVISAESLLQALRPDTILAAVGHANNEIGVIQDIASFGQICRQRGVYLLVDAVQTVGHIPVHTAHVNCDVLSLSAHKFYGPLGVGALYLRKGVSCDPFLLGGDQERGRRAATQNLPGIVGLSKAIDLCRQYMEQEAKTQAPLRDQVMEAVLKALPGVKINGDRLRRLPNNAHFSFEMTDGEELVAALDLAGISVSIGSACTSGQLEPSHVLKAIGLSDRLALGSLRVTLGRYTTKAETDYFTEQLILCKTKSSRS